MTSVLYINRRAGCTQRGSPRLTGSRARIYHRRSTSAQDGDEPTTALRAPRPTFAWWVVGWELRTPRRSRKGASMASRQHTGSKSRRYAVALVAGAIALLVAACGGSSGGSSSSGTASGAAASGGTTTITMWHGYAAASP